ncbi:FAD-dependent oxidoreductase [Streptomyces sp. B6B3]|uniref:NAD(P)/FAD-dependent oxidoreductase n=1 Tax=Streptomyces sp. B6B3 TaxID=3153570 RepID=UPI00325C489B
MTGPATDCLVVGAGIAGAAAGYFLAHHGHRVTLLEAEAAPGTHATGRSAALFSEYYGNPTVRALTSASRPFYDAPPPDVHPGHSGPPAPLLRPRGVLALQTPGSEALFAPALAAGATAPQPATALDAPGARRLVPALRPGACERAIHRPGACDIDTDAVHSGFLRGLRAAGGTVVTRARVTALARRGGRWHAATTAGPHVAPVLVNAAGAWADEVAALAGLAPAGLVPLRRTVAIAAVPPDQADAVARWPMICDLADTFYAKPEPGGLLLSPSDAMPFPPGDPRPDELGVAAALDRVRAVVALDLKHIRHAWAGLRTAPDDDTPVIGQHPAEPAFWWLAGLGGYGFQTAPAAATLLAALIAGREPSPGLAALAPAVSPARAGAAPSSRTRPR